MRCAVFGTKRFDREFLTAANDRLPPERRVTLVFVEADLSMQTAALAAGCGAAVLFVNDRADRATLGALKKLGVGMLALRSAGFNHVDLAAAAELGIAVARVPAYSPHAVAEHAVALLMALVRHLPRALARTREHNFALDGLMGFDLFGKTVGVVGTGKIGAVFARIMLGFGCRVLAFDPVRDAELERAGVVYGPVEELLRASDVISLHCPLTPQTRHLIGERALALMKPGVVVINTSRGAVVDTRALIKGLKSKRVSAVGLDVYEEEGDYFFRDLSDEVMEDDVLARLFTFPNVVVTAHQAFFTREALTNIGDTTVGNLAAFAAGGAGALSPQNVVSAT